MLKYIEAIVLCSKSSTGLNIIGDPDGDKSDEEEAIH
jgi:hypothetical protein